MSTKDVLKSYKNSEKQKEEKVKKASRRVFITR